MNPLDTIKDKLKMKPTLEERKPVEIVVGAPKQEEVTIRNITIKQDINKDYKRDELKERLKTNKLTKVTMKYTPPKQLVETMQVNQIKIIHKLLTSDHDFSEISSSQLKQY